MNIEYRVATQNDFYGLEKLINDNFNIKLKQIVSNNDQYNIIAVCGDKVVGNLLFTKIYNPIKDIYYGKIDYVCVDINYRNNHIATKLLDFVEKKEKSIDYFELTSNKLREAANKLYLSEGYEIIDTNLFRKYINVKKNL